MSRPIKRSFSIKGHRTSLSLEDAFWVALNDVASQEGITPTALVARIDEQRHGAGLSSAVRVYLLKHYRHLQPNDPAEEEDNT